jgi:hypothetical protein
VGGRFPASESKHRARPLDAYWEKALKGRVERALKRMATP